MATLIQLQVVKESKQVACRSHIHQHEHDDVLLLLKEEIKISHRWCMEM